MDGQIYFFDDNINNQIPDEGYEDLNINFIHIPAGNYNDDHLFLFQNNFYVNAEDDIAGHLAGPFQMPQFRGYDALGRPLGLNPHRFYRDSGFHIEPDDDEDDDDEEPTFGDYAHGGTLALIFDWDQTMTLTNGMILGDGNTLQEQLEDLIQGGDVPEDWTTETLARWYLHDPDDANRIMNLRDFFEEVQGMQIPVFILTANGLSTNNPQIMPDILRAALNLEIPPDRLIRAGYEGGITKPEAIRDQIMYLAAAHWDAVAAAAAPAEAAAPAVAEAAAAAEAPAAEAPAAEAPDAEGPAKKKQKKGGRRKTRRKRCKRRKTRRRKRRRRTRQKKRRRRRKKTRK